MDQFDDSTRMTKSCLVMLDHYYKDSYSDQFIMNVLSHHYMFKKINN